jgi:hypothetical protein
MFVPRSPTYIVTRSSSHRRDRGAAPRNVKGVEVGQTACAQEHPRARDLGKDIFISFSTANPGAAGSDGPHQLTMLSNDQLNRVFLATVQATEEAVVNAMVAAATMTGVNGHTVAALSHDQLHAVLKKYNRLMK